MSQIALESLTIFFAMATNKLPMMLQSQPCYKQQELTISPSMQKKIVFKSQDCAFFGGHLTPAGYKMDPQKVQAISEMKPPANLQDLQSFLGLVNYLNRFSPALAVLTTPLRALRKKDTLFACESSQQAPFEAIKKEITSVSVLLYFDQSKATTIQSDASKKGLGEVKLQDDKPVIYASRALAETEQRYSNIERSRATQRCLCS